MEGGRSAEVASHPVDDRYDVLKLAKSGSSSDRGVVATRGSSVDTPSFPDSQYIFTRLAQTAIANRLMRRLFLAILSLFGFLRYCEASRRNMLSVAAKGVNPFDRNTISRNFRGLYPALSFSALLEDADTDPFMRAGKLIYAALEYRRTEARKAHGSSAADTVRIELRHAHIFGRVVTLFGKRMAVHKRISDYSDSDFIAVAVGGKWYRLPVYEYGQTVDPLRLASTLSAIADDARTNIAINAYGALTAVATKDQSQCSKREVSPLTPLMQRCLCWHLIWKQHLTI